MRIGIDARPLSYPLTGIGFYLKCLLDTLQETDHKNHYCLISNAPINYKLANSKWSKVEGRLPRKLMSTLWMQVWGPVAVHRRRIDLFWSPRHHLPLLLPRRIRTVLTVHDVVHRRYPETMFLPNLIAERLLLRWSLERADAVITDSRSTASDVQLFYQTDRAKIQIIHPGTPPLLDLNPGNDAIETLRFLPSKYFLFVGTLDPRKNFMRLFCAFESISPELCDLHLLLVGAAGWKNKHFQEMLRHHPLKNYIHVTGYVSRDVLVVMYRKALCLLFPSLYEGFGFPILEAMAMGTPVITSNTSSMPEVAGDAAVLVNPYDVRAIADAMLKVYKNHELRAQLRRRGYERVPLFSWKPYGEAILEVFQRVTNP